MLKKLLANVGEYKRESIITPLLVVGEVILDILIPLVMAMLIDQGIEKANTAEIIRLGIILFVLAIIALILGTLSGRYAAIASAGFAKNLRQNMFSHIQSFSFSNIDRFSASSLVTRLTTDITNVQNAYQMVIRILVRSPLIFIFSLIMAFVINKDLALNFLFVIPFLAIGLALVIRFAHPLFERVFRIYDHLNNVVQENLQGIRVVKSYVREQHEDEKFGEVSEEMYKTYSRAQKIVAFNNPLMQFCMYTCMLLISWMGAKLIVGGSMTTGELVSMFTYVMQILMSLNMLSMVFVMTLIARASAERIVEVLDEESDLKNDVNPVSTIADGSVTFKDVCFSYANDPDKLALIDVNLAIKPGEVIGIIGGTGSSKSSLVQLIPRLYDATKGVVEVGGLNVKAYDLTALRDQVSMVLQNNVLFSGTIKDNLRWGNESATEEDMIRVCKIAQADSFIQEFPDKYDTMITQGGTNVSGGQKQRLCIARALLKHPKILILDDSTSAVDTKTERLIREGIRSEIPGTTTFIISQRISSVEDADRVIVMDNGRVNAIDTPAKLLQENQIYQEVYQSQQKGFGQHAE